MLDELLHVFGGWWGHFNFEDFFEWVGGKLDGLVKAVVHFVEVGWVAVFIVDEWKG